MTDLDVMTEAEALQAKSEWTPPPGANGNTIVNPQPLETVQRWVKEAGEFGWLAVGGVGGSHRIRASAVVALTASQDDA